MASKASTDYFRKGSEPAFKGGSELVQKEGWRQRNVAAELEGVCMEQGRLGTREINRYRKPKEMEEGLNPSRKL